MKVLLITRTMASGGGAESLLYQLYKKLKVVLGEQNVMLIYFQKSEIFNFENIDNYEIEFMEDSNFKHVEITFKLNFFGKNDIDISSLKNEIENFNPDVIHSHLYLSELYSRSVFNIRIKWFTHLHDNIFQFRNFDVKTLFNKRLLVNYLEKKYLFNKYQLNGGNNFIAVSNDTYRYAKRVCGNYPVFLLNNFIDTNKFYFQNKRDLSKIKIINVGSFTKNKNQKFFIEIAKDLLKRDLDFEITLIGYGAMKIQLEELVQKNNLVDYFKFTGSVMNVEDYLNNSNIYVHVAISESFGISLLEAMATGLPVVTYNTGGINDFINDENGALIDQFKAKHFSESILNILISGKKNIIFSNV